MTQWYLFLDDESNPPWNDPVWKVARSSQEAIELVKKNGIPFYMSLDHNLGRKDSPEIFITWLAKNFPLCPVYSIHSCAHTSIDPINLKECIQNYHKIYLANP